jgi:hypothetical protein
LKTKSRPKKISPAANDNKFVTEDKLVENFEAYDFEHN